MAKNTKNSLIRTSFLQALGVTIYCSFVGLFFWKGNEVFGKVGSFLGPVTFLLLFSASALICGLLVFYKPYTLFFDGKKKQAADLVLYTSGWLFAAFVVFLMIILKYK